MAEPAVLDSPAPSPVEDAPPSPEAVAAEGFGAVGQEAELGAEGQFEQAEEIGEDDPRVSKLLAEQQRRREQALKDQREALIRERDQAAARAAAAARVQWERQQASEQGKQQRREVLKQLLGKALEAEDIDQAGAAELDALEASVQASAWRNALDGFHQYGTTFMQAKFGGFYMPNEWIPHYQQALATGQMDVASGLVLETTHLLGYREGFAAAQKALANATEAEETADQKAERLRQERAEATAPGAAPVRRAGGSAPRQPRTQVEAAQWFNEGRITADQYNRYRRGDNPLPYQ